MEGIEFLKELINLIGLVIKYGFLFLVVTLPVIFVLGKIAERFQEREQRKANK